jgi:3-oxoacyl-[acyl-carrier protein] reductase
MGRRAPHEQPVVLVTGASGGLGRAVAMGFANAGYRVAVNCRTAMAEADKTADEIAAAGGTACVYQADVRQEHSVSAMMDLVMTRWGRLDALICNAAVTEDALLLRVADDAWDRVIGTILTGTFHCMRSAAAIMAAQGDGAMILMGSLSGLQGRSGQAPYAAAKAGLLGLMRTAAREWGPDHIRVNMMLPGWHATALTGFTDDASPPPFGPVLGHGTNMEDVAQFAVSLAAMRNVSGQVFQLDSRISGL